MTSFPGYDDHDATGLAGLVRSGEASAADLLDEALRRAAAIQPRLNPIVTLLEAHARAVAAAAPSGPFGGVPFLLKDLLQPLGGVRMTCGSDVLRDYVPEHDAEVVRRFERAGLVVFGKSNVPEFGLVATTEPRAFGPTRNPWDPSRSSGGSSGGAAAAVAAGILPMAGANDGGGSIRIPAAWCGLFGMKPSRGRVSAGPYYGETWGGAVVDHVLCRSVRDSALALDVTVGPAPGDPFPVALPPRPFVEEVGAEPGRLRIAFTTRSPVGAAVDPECAAAVTETAALLESLGHEVIEAEPPIDGMEVARTYLFLYFGYVAAEVAWVERTFGRSAARRGLEEVTRVIATVGRAIPAPEFVASRQRWNDFGRAMGEFHRSYDLYMTPTTAALPVPIGTLGPSLVERMALVLVNRLRAGRLLRMSGVVEGLALENLGPVPFTQLANLTGQPAMSVPLHWSAGGLPCGVHFMAPVGEEARLYRLAAQLETARPWRHRRPPVSAASAGVARP